MFIYTFAIICVKKPDLIISLYLLYPVCLAFFIIVSVFFLFATISQHWSFSMVFSDRICLNLEKKVMAYWKLIERSLLVHGFVNIMLLISVSPKL